MLDMAKAVLIMEEFWGEIFFNRNDHFEKSAAKNFGAPNLFSKRISNFLPSFPKLFFYI